MKAQFNTTLPFVVLYFITFCSLWTYGDWFQAGLSAALAPMLIWLSVCDMNTLEIPDIATLGVAIVSAVAVWISGTASLVVHLSTGLLVMGFFWLVGELYFRHAKQEGLGIGDAKLFGAGAILLGPLKLPEFLLFSSLGGIVGYLMATVFSNGPRQGIPFGPFVAYSIFILSLLNGVFV
ncbi:prepilin peptidase [Ruegeria sp.]|uniref:prepilin peptidase n=1 Tax=Ruegeria sp. TaxID=1879320 RepID=UPI003C7B6410